jgi:hypothetical protein
VPAFTDDGKPPVFFDWPVATQNSPDAFPNVDYDAIQSTIGLFFDETAPPNNNNRLINDTNTYAIGVFYKVRVRPCRVSAGNWQGCGTEYAAMMQPCMAPHARLLQLTEQGCQAHKIGDRVGYLYQAHKIGVLVGYLYQDHKIGLLLACLQGKLIAEQYATSLGYDKDTKLNSNSIIKSFYINYMTGLRSADGKMSIDDLVGAPYW